MICNSHYYNLFGGSSVSDDYLTFLSASDSDISVTPSSSWNATTKEYSTDRGKTWNTYTSGSVTGRRIKFRGLGGSIASSYTPWTSTGDYYCSGNIETVLNYRAVELGQHPSMGDYCFFNMFHYYSGYGYGQILSAPEMPATTLSEGCYKWMFQSCSSLTTPPVLPATVLADSCYESMFSGCTSLTTPPVLPATVLADSCYDGMLASCRSLTEAPELPATDLKSKCYRAMFMNCSALTTPPVLPATVLAGRCYESMFSGCTSLTTIPRLPATTLAGSCYKEMFYGCTGIGISDSSSSVLTNEFRVPTYGTGTTATDWNLYMFTDTSGSFTGDPTINTTYYTSNDIGDIDYLTFTSADGTDLTVTPSSGWGSGYGITREYSVDKGETWNTYTSGSVTGKVIKFRGITLASTKASASSKPWHGDKSYYCSGNVETVLDYQDVKNNQEPPKLEATFCGMFENESNLLTAPSLPTLTLTVYNQYAGMFKGCSSLVSAPSLPATTLYQWCYSQMFQDCTSLVNTPTLSAPATYECYWAMFRGCSSLKTAPALPSSSVGYCSYAYMFLDCSRLETAPSLPATTLYESCYEGMFKNCTNLTSLPYLPATTLCEDCYLEMFEGCSSIKLSSTQTGDYQTAYKIPKTGTGTTATGALTDMFVSTGGTFTGTPTLNTTYYTSNTVV